MGFPLDDFLKSLDEIKSNFGNKHISQDLKEFAAEFVSAKGQAEQSLKAKQRQERIKRQLGL